MATAYTNPADMVSSGLQAYDTTTGAITGRTLTAGAGISITNGSGTAGNPTITSTVSPGFPGTYTNVSVSSDFCGGDVSSPIYDSNFYSNSPPLLTVEAGHPGIIALTSFIASGVHSTGNAATSAGTTMIAICRTTDTTLNDGASSCITVGFRDDWNAGNPSTTPDNVVGFKWTTGSANWIAVTRTAADEENSDTGIAVSTAWRVFKIVINQAGNSVTFYIDGTLVATNTTHIPAANIPLWAAVANSSNSDRGMFYVDFMSTELQANR